MKVLVDTSVWVDWINNRSSPERTALKRLLASADHDPCTCGVVITEVFQGLRHEKGRDEFEVQFRTLTYLEPSGIDLYFRAAEVYRGLRARGWTVRSTIDCVIAILAEEHGCSILARDSDFTEILASGLIKASRWPVETL